MLILKIGGGKTINWDYIISDLTSLIKKEAVILVHGASAIRDEMAKKMGVATKYLIAPSGQIGVYTDQKAIDVLTMVYAGLVNKQIVAKLQKAGINAVGLSGADGKIWLAQRKKYLLSIESDKTKLIKDTLTGKVKLINTKLIRLLIKNDYLPVITQPAISDEGELVNTDNDRNIAVMARALGIKKLVVFFGTPGLLKNINNEKSIIHRINKNRLDDYLTFAQGRMKKKILAAKEAFTLGVKKIYWGDGRIKNPILSILSGKGTIIK